MEALARVKPKRCKAPTASLVATPTGAHLSELCADIPGPCEVWLKNCQYVCMTTISQRNPCNMLDKARVHLGAVADVPQDQRILVERPGDGHKRNSRNTSPARSGRLCRSYNRYLAWMASQQLVRCNHTPNKVTRNLSRWCLHWPMQGALCGSGISVAALARQPPHLQGTQHRLTAKQLAELHQIRT